MFRAMATESKSAKALKALRARSGLSVRALADLLEMSPSSYQYYEDDYKKPYLPRELVDKLTEHLSISGIDRAEIDALAGKNIGILPFPQQIPVLPRPPLNETYPFGQSRDLPLLGAAKGGDGEGFMSNGEVFGHVSRPGNLVSVNNAYGVYMTGTSMEPRYWSGWVLGVNPNKPVSKGNAVVVQVLDEEHGEMRYLVKLFVRRDANKVVLEQLNPKEQITLPAKAVVAMHRITGSIEDD